MHVEDDADIREIAAMALDMADDMEVEQFPGGAEALEAAPSLAPDILLLDVMMPGMSGEELLRQLREVPKLQSVPAVFMTARAQESEIETLKGLGAADVIVKPFDPMSLADRLREIAAR